MSTLVNPFVFGGGSGPGGAYQHVRPITIDHTKVPNTNQTDFPMLFSGMFTYLKTTANGGDVTNVNGYDIIFTSDAAGLTQLDHEIESYDPTTGAVNFWIRIPTLATATDTVIYIHYGNNSISTSQENVTGVWDSDFALVVHMTDGTTLDALDSTANNIAPTISGPTAAAGKFDGGADFNVSFARISYTHAKLRPTGAITVSCWAKRGSTGTVDMMFARTNGTTNAGSSYTLAFIATNFPRFEINDGSGWRTALSSTVFTDTTNFHFWCGTFDGSTVKLYRDGALDASFSFTGSINDPNESLFLGVTRNTTANDFQPGVMDEVRVSFERARTADWIATEYNNQSSPGTFFSVGPEL